LRDAVESLLRDPARRHRQGALAYQHARQHFTADRMVAGYMDLYQSLVPARAISA
jgi:glycosyltransferase involved in cell wall biosynthesis